MNPFNSGQPNNRSIVPVYSPLNGAVPFIPIAIGSNQTFIAQPVPIQPLVYTQSYTPPLSQSTQVLQSQTQGSVSSYTTPTQSQVHETFNNDADDDTDDDYESNSNGTNCPDCNISPVSYHIHLNYEKNNR